jgi:hypothetical protein
MLKLVKQKSLIKAQLVVLGMAACLLFLFSPLTGAAQSVASLEKAENALSKQWEGKLEYRPLSDDHFTAVYKGSELVAYLCVNEAASKHDVFDYMIVYSPDLQIIKVQVLAYREDYGFEIKSKRWLKQFTQRKVEEVQAISGATISVESLKRAVSSSTKSLAELL